MRFTKLARVFCGMIVVWGTMVQAEPWGDLTGRFVYDGQAPPRRPLVVTADVEYCGRQELLEEHLIVHPENSGVANVVVWLFVGRGDEPPIIHESYASTAKSEVVLDTVGCRFEPHVSLLRTSQTLILRNSDPIGDNIKIDTLFNPPINITLPARTQVRHRFTIEERLPARVSCGIHPWESGWLLVKELPYMAVSDENGYFRIENLPVGEWTFQFWHEQAGNLDDVTLDGQQTRWARGRSAFHISSGEKDLGDLLLSPRLFAQ